MDLWSHARFWILRCGINVTCGDKHLCKCIKEFAQPQLQIVVVTRYAPMLRQSAIKRSNLDDGHKYYLFRKPNHQTKSERILDL